MMWQNVVKDYLTFSKKERNGIIVILILSAIVFLFSRYFPINKPTVDNRAFQKELASLQISIDTSQGLYTSQQEDKRNYIQQKHYEHYPLKEAALFSFDPNTLNDAGWKRLGLRDKTISTIEHFIAKGYRFRQPEDLKKIYGLRQEEAERLAPYVHIIEKETSVRTPFEKHDDGASKKLVFEVKTLKIIDINKADTAEFISLPGIGNKLAARIVNFRQKLGGFISVNQLGETYGIPDSTFQIIKGRMQCNDPLLKKININTAEANELKLHPYLRWNIANAIVNYRTQHGMYKSVEELHKIEIINDELFNKIAPYLIL